MQKSYYESQTNPKWNTQRIEFETKMEELKNVKTDLITQKKTLESPKNYLVCSGKKCQEIQILFAIKEEENASLVNLVDIEKQKYKDLLSDFDNIKNYSKEIEKRLSLCQLQLIEKEKTIARYFSEINSAKQIVQQWLKPAKKPSDTFQNFPKPLSESPPAQTTDKTSSIKSLQEAYEKENTRLKKQLESTQELYNLKNLELIKLKEKLFINENSSQVNFSVETQSLSHSNLETQQKSQLIEEIHQKSLQLSQQKEDFEILEEQYKIQIHELESVIVEQERVHYENKYKYENSLKKKNQDIEELDKKIQNLMNEPYKVSNKNQLEYIKEIEEHKINIQILKENNQLLLEKITNYEEEKKNFFNEKKKESKAVAQEFSKVILRRFSNEHEKPNILSNLCMILMENKPIFEELIENIFGKNYSKLYEIMVEKVKILEKENTYLKKNFGIDKSVPEVEISEKSLKIDIDTIKNTSRKISSSMNQENLSKIAPNRAHETSKSFSVKLLTENPPKAIFEPLTSSVFPILGKTSNIPTKSLEKRREIPDISNCLPQRIDLIYFLQCCASSLEDTLIN